MWMSPDDELPTHCPAPPADKEYRFSDVTDCETTRHCGLRTAAEPAGTGDYDRRAAGTV